MKTTLNILVLVISLLLIAGCVTPREIIPAKDPLDPNQQTKVRVLTKKEAPDPVTRLARLWPRQDQPVAAADETLPPEPVEPEQGTIKLNYWRSWFEPNMEKRVDQVLNREQFRREGMAWHARALEAANDGKIIEPPNAIPDGSRPVVFINDRDYPIWVEYWQADRDISQRPRFRVPSAYSYDGQNYVVRYLEGGGYFWQVDDYRGNPIFIRKDKGDGRSYSRVRTSTFGVWPTPNFEYLGTSYFGIVRVFGGY